MSPSAQPLHLLLGRPVAAEHVKKRMLAHFHSDLAVCRLVDGLEFCPAPSLHVFISRQGSQNLIDAVPQINDLGTPNDPQYMPPLYTRS